MGKSISTIAEALEAYGPSAYLITWGETSPHTSRVDVALDGGRLRLTLGASAVRNGTRQEQVSLLWPPPDADGYDLIVNGRLTVDGSEPVGSVAISKAVLHRPGTPDDPASGCRADCRRLGFAG